MCECDVGYTSANCADSCIDKCSSRGVCKSPTVPCDCFDGYIGDGCGLICPTDIDGQICSGNGTCTEEGGVAVCTCFEGRAGDICAEIADYSSSKTSGKLSGGAIAGYAFLCVGIVMILAIGFYVRRRYTKKITYYEKILADLPADDARIQSLIDEGGLEVPVDDNRIVPDADMQGSDKRRSSGMVPLESISM